MRHLQVKIKQFETTAVIIPFLLVWSHSDRSTCINTSSLDTCSPVLFHEYENEYRQNVSRIDEFQIDPVRALPHWNRGFLCQVTTPMRGRQYNDTRCRHTAHVSTLRTSLSNPEVRRSTLISLIWNSSIRVLVRVVHVRVQTLILQLSLKIDVTLCGSWITPDTGHGRHVLPEIKLWPWLGASVTSDLQHTVSNEIPWMVRQ